MRKSKPTGISSLALLVTAGALVACSSSSSGTTTTPPHDSGVHDSSDNGADATPDDGSASDAAGDDGGSTLSADSGIGLPCTCGTDPTMACKASGASTGCPAGLTCVGLGGAAFANCVAPCECPSGMNCDGSGSVCPAGAYCNEVFAQGTDEGAWCTH